MKRSFSQRNPMILGAAGLAVVAGLVAIALGNRMLPFLNHDKDYTAYFADAGGLFSGAIVQVSGYPVGKVSSIELQEAGVLVTFGVPGDIHMGDRTEAAIRTKGLLGTKELDVTPLGDGQLTGPIPLDRTTSPYQLPDALGDLATRIGDLDTNQLSDTLTALADTFADTPPQLRDAVQGVTRFARTLNTRDDQLRRLLDDAARATGVLARRTDRIVSLIHDTDALLVALRTQSAALDQLAGNISAVSGQLKEFIADNRRQLKPALDKLNGVLAIVDSRKQRIQEAVKGLSTYSMSLGETVASGPFFKAYVVNLLPGQFVQPFVDAAFSDLGLDPATLPPSQLGDPQTGQPGTPALPVPYPRTGQGGQPRLNLPDAITGNPGDQGCGPPDRPLPGPTGCYPYRQPAGAPAPGGPPPGPPAPEPSGTRSAPEPSGTRSAPEPTPSPVLVPAPGEPTGTGDPS